MTPFGKWEAVSQVPEDPEERWLLSSRNPPVRQAELISGHSDSILKFGELELPLDLTLAHYEEDHGIIRGQG